MTTPRYIVIEGLDGCGKSTQHQLLLEAFGKDILGVREPGGTPMGEAIRALIKNPDLPRSPRTNAFLFSAARAELFDTVVRPAIAQKRHVVSDRNWLSTLAYQVAEGADNQDEILALCRLATKEFFTPDLVIFIDTTVDTCRKRVHSRGRAMADYFDAKGGLYFTQVRQNYLKLLKILPHVAIVDGNQEIPVIAHEVIALVRAMIR